MDENRAPVGLLISAVAAAVLAISVFLPWYGVSITPSGAAAAQQEIAAVAKQYGNQTFQVQANGLIARFGSLAGHPIAMVTARQAVKRESLILLVLAGIALLASLLRLADARGLLFATGRQISLAGGLAGAIVFFRILVRPGAGVGIVSFSLSWGILLALLSAAAIVGGGILAGSDRSWKHATVRPGPGPPPLQAPPNIREVARGSLSPPASRRR